MEAKNMGYGRRLLSILWAGFLAFVILFVGQFVWGALVLANIKTSPRIPWAVVAMALVLWLMWQYLSGRWWPQSTAEVRRRNLRALPVSSQTFFWAIAAGIFSIAALSGLWIVLFQISRTPPNALPDISRYPLTTVIPLLLMSCLAAPFSEEAAFRGYAQSILERNFRGPTAIVISSALFAAAHLTYGLLWTKLTAYFLAGLVFALTAHLAKSILPAIAVHAMADLTFFTLVWPHDAARRLVNEGGADTWFWIHVAQIVAGAVLAAWCFRKLARSHGARDSHRLEAAGSLTASV
jgi:membrane protease YdiL (CAAX protease family)